MKWSKVRKPKGFRRGVLRSLLEKKMLARVKRYVSKNVTVGIESHDIPYTVVRNYVPDIILVFPNGHVRYIEVKGWYRPEDRAKMKAVKQCNPELDIRMAFGSNNKLNKNTDTRYGDWCDKHGFPWCVGEIPKEWLKA